MIRKHSLLTLLVSTILCIGFVACGNDNEDPILDERPAVDNSGNSSKDNSGNTTDGDKTKDFVIGGKWKINSIDGKTWYQLAFNESEGYIVFEKDSSFTTRKGGYHLLNLTGKCRYLVKGNDIQIYNNGVMAAKFTIKSYSNNTANVELSQGNRTRILVMELQPLIYYNKYDIKFVLPDYTQCYDTEYSFFIKDGDNKYDIIKTYISSRITEFQYTTTKNGHLRVSSKKGSSSNESWFTDEYIELKSATQEGTTYSINFPYWKYDSRAYSGYSTSVIAGTVTLYLLESKASYDDEGEGEEENPGDAQFSSYYVNVILTANSADIQGCTFKYFIGTKEAKVGDYNSWLIKENSVLSIFTYVGSTLKGFKDTTIEAKDGFYSEIEFYDKNKKIQKGHVTVTGVQ